MQGKISFRLVTIMINILFKVKRMGKYLLVNLQWRTYFSQRDQIFPLQKELAKSTIKVFRKLKTLKEITKPFLIMLKAYG